MDRLLQALNCPFRKDFNINSRKHIVILVRWLEDRKIREYEVEDRDKFLGDDDNVDVIMMMMKLIMLMWWWLWISGDIDNYVGEIVEEYEDGDDNIDDGDWHMRHSSYWIYISISIYLYLYMYIIFFFYLFIHLHINSILFYLPL